MPSALTILLPLFFYFHAIGSYDIMLYVQHSQPLCELSLQSNDKVFKFAPTNGFSTYNIGDKWKIDAKHLSIVSKECASTQLDKLVIINKEYIMNSEPCGHPCCWFDVYRNKSHTSAKDQRCRITSTHGHSRRSLLSSNETDTATGGDNRSNYDESFDLGRRFYGLPILVYFAFLFGIVCIVWICCIVALCIGYSKRRKAIRLRGENIRRRKQQSKPDESCALNDEASDDHHMHQRMRKNKVIATTRSPRPNIILPLPPQRDTQLSPRALPTNSNPKPATTMMILPTPTALLTRHKANAKAKETRDTRGAALGLSAEMSSTQKSYPSDNDIIQQMEKDWASENGTNIFDSPLRDLAGTGSTPSLDLMNSQFNSVNTNSKNISIIYAKHFGLITATHEHNMSGDTRITMDVINDDDDDKEVKRVRPHTTRPYHEYHYYDHYDGDANSDPSYASSESVPLNTLHKQRSRKSRRTQSDTSIYSSDYDARKRKNKHYDYTTKNAKNPFQINCDFGNQHSYDEYHRYRQHRQHRQHRPHHVYHMSLQQQIQMKHNHELQSPDLEPQVIQIDYAQYSQPISLPNHNNLSKDDSLRFPKESMPFNNEDAGETQTETDTVTATATATETETETDTETGRGIGIQIRIEKYEYEDRLSHMQSRRANNNHNNNNNNNKVSLQEPVGGPLSPISNTPQPISAPLSPKALSNTMPIRPLSQAKKSPFHLPPQSIALQRIHSPEPLHAPKSSSQTTSTGTTPSKSDINLNAKYSANGTSSQSKSRCSVTESSHRKSKSSQSANDFKAKTKGRRKGKRNGKAKNKSNRNKKHDLEILCHYSLDQTDLFEKLAQMENDDDISDDDNMALIQ